MGPAAEFRSIAFVLGTAAHLWSLLGGDPSSLDHLQLLGERRVLPSVFDVTGMATAAVGVAALAVAELQAARTNSHIPPVTVTTREAAAAFRCEALFAPEGWERPPAWDPIAGDYQAADGWIRLHTNYAHHRGAALRALGLTTGDHATVTARAAQWQAVDLESRVVEEGGAAAAMHTREEWLAHPQGSATAGDPPVQTLAQAAEGHRHLPRVPASAPPLEGIRVLDLTRVIAGPFATRFLAGWGASVLRLDPPGFEEVPALIPEATAGKRCAFVDLKDREGRAAFLALIREADVIVAGYRPDALERLGIDDAWLRAANPCLVISRHNAYGWAGPWTGRRGFDSLVQMSCGIAAAQGLDRPRPLPAQVLDHATAMLLAAAICRALTSRQCGGAPADIRASLIGVANLLYGLPDPSASSAQPPAWDDADTEARQTWWGPARAVPVPGRVGERRPRLAVQPGPLGRHALEFDRSP